MNSIELWLPTAISATMLGLLVFFMKTSYANLKCDLEEKVKMIEAKSNIISERLSVDEDKYLTEKDHGHICGENTSSLKLHINEVMKQMRNDFDKKFDKLYEVLDKISRRQ